MSRDSFIFYRTFATVCEIPEIDARDRIMSALIFYALDGKQPELIGIEKALFESFRYQIDQNNKRYENGCKGAEYGYLGAEYGKLGGRPRKEKDEKQGQENAPNNPPKTPQKPRNNPRNDNDNDNVNDNIYSANAHARESFCKTYGIAADAEPPPAIDFEKLTKAYSQSTLLQNPTKAHFHKMSWIIKNYEKIIDGTTFVDYDKEKQSNSGFPIIVDKSAEELNAAFAELSEEDL